MPNEVWGHDGGNTRRRGRQPLENAIRLEVLTKNISCDS